MTGCTDSTHITYPHSFRLLTWRAGRGPGAHETGGGAGADCSMDGRTDSSSTQYGTAWTRSGSSVAEPWMNLLNLCTCRRRAPVRHQSGSLAIVQATSTRMLTPVSDTTQ